MTVEISLKIALLTVSILVGLSATWWIDRQLSARLPRWHKAIGMPMLLTQWTLWFWVGLSVAAPGLLSAIYPYLALAIGLFLSVLVVQAAIDPLRQTMYRPPPRIFFDSAQALISLTVVILLTANLFDGVDLQSIFTWVFTISTVGAVVIGFALQETLANFIAGISLQMDAPFQQGDWIAVENCYGEILSLNWRATVLRTIDREIISIPNSTIGRSQLINYSREQAFAKQVEFGLSYDVPPSRAIQVLHDAAQSVDGVLPRPPVSVFVHRYADFSIVYQVLYWSRLPGEQRRIRSQIRQRVWYALGRAHMQVPFPIRDIVTRSYKPAERQLPDDALERLKAVDFLRVCEQQQLQRFLDLGHCVRYTVGETICKVGEPGDRFYIIFSGQVHVLLKPGRPVLARLGTGEYFGEIAVLTGQVRTATVMAVEDTELLAFERPAFQSLIDSHPMMGERIAQVIAERQRKQQMGDADEAKQLEETASLFELMRSGIVKIFGR